MNDKIKETMEMLNGMKRKFFICNENGEEPTEKDKGKTLYCIFKMDNGENAIFWGDIYFKMHGEETFLLTECNATGKGKDAIITINFQTGNQTARLINYEPKYVRF